ncbi:MULTISPECIES: carbon storage regulator [unclassified Ectothiorhodospira]|uniref:carbon storage regulator n=1 Tax=unclassified Ectothiorhodospira TaxID=2684909 RepID=UPI001EE7FCD6|nr:MULTISPECIES: carbon storage regulator [unclassified Ectothiorhodospira]MCG5514764.1 carbon storage regulator [Ectothiorhodospira sp. 9100]MCG5518932.1 carbon storage regulator [Ectothiorhodospira sp. 9905]
MVIFDLTINERVSIGGEVVIEPLKRSGGQVKLGISAPPHMEIFRKELYENIQMLRYTGTEKAPGG